MYNTYITNANIFHPGLELRFFRRSLRSLPPPGQKASSDDPRRPCDKGMPIEQVQRLLGHVKIDTTLHYAMVNQANVKMAHRKYLA